MDSLDVVGYYWFILTSVATGCYWFLTKMMDFGWILIDAIDLTLVDKMDFGGLWLIWGSKLNLCCAKFSRDCIIIIV